MVHPKSTGMYAQINHKLPQLCTHLFFQKAPPPLLDQFQNWSSKCINKHLHIYYSLPKKFVLWNYQVSETESTPDSTVIETGNINASDTQLTPGLKNAMDWLQYLSDLCLRNHSWYQYCSWYQIITRKSENVTTIIIEYSAGSASFNLRKFFIHKL
jgi:hypothetical protein